MALFESTALAYGSGLGFVSYFENLHLGWDLKQADGTQAADKARTIVSKIPYDISIFCVIMKYLTILSLN